MKSLNDGTFFIMVKVHPEILRRIVQVRKRKNLSTEVRYNVTRNVFYRNKQTGRTVIETRQAKVKK